MYLTFACLMFLWPWLNYLEPQSFSSFKVWFSFPVATAKESKMGYISYKYFLMGYISYNSVTSSEIQVAFKGFPVG